MTSPEAKKAFDIQAEPDKLRDEYGRNTLGQSCLMARRLVEAGVRCVTIDHSNWDTHDDNFATLKRQLLPWLDAGLSTLFRDLADRGLLETTLVLVTGEFGRTPRINKNAGRDHWGPAFTVALGGGGIQGGRVVGKTDARAERPAGDPLRPGRPVGDDLPPARHRSRGRVLHARRPAGQDRQQRPRDSGVAVEQTNHRVAETRGDSKRDEKRHYVSTRSIRTRRFHLLFVLLCVSVSRG